MAQPDTLVLIPARMAATRLPGKPLKDIAGLPMIVHVWRRAESARIGRVVVATDAPDIAAAVTAHGGEASDADEPARRSRTIGATIEASAGRLPAADRDRFAELAVFAEDAAVPFDLVGLLWATTGGLAIRQAYRLVGVLDSLGLVEVGGGALSLHDVIREHLQDPERRPNPARPWSTGTVFRVQFAI